MDLAGLTAPSASSAPPYRERGNAASCERSPLEQRNSKRPDGAPTPIREPSCSPLGASQDTSNNNRNAGADAQEFGVGKNFMVARRSHMPGSGIMPIRSDVATGAERGGGPSHHPSAWAPSHLVIVKRHWHPSDGYHRPVSSPTAPLRRAQGRYRLRALPA